MPKIIEGIEDKIFTSAFDLFSEHGYKNVDMKIIAKKSGIAVGTLYNYYPNKKTLFLNVFNKSWIDTFKKLDNIIYGNLNKQTKIKKFVQILYDEIYERKGMGKHLIRSSKFNNQEINIKQELLLRLKKIISIDEKDEELKCKYQIRLLQTILVTVITMMNEHPEEYEENIDYLSNYLWVIYENIEKY
ncbi:TetR/AcrR family transcriptional regulator [Senegalia massiliensis]|uniref:TetR/AcrR family transcriptional regulator n=1 Tax=Senegalia massiliensis TaxID=1720316 RepID=A0A845QU19_9CLOT|nr:TetR/AcrR family transcriptional regulator [Senegalia massiliensis]NBI06025.1 TetR/AcrR family transcriptional regulator [Senegalia massiliensis]